MCYLASTISYRAHAVDQDCGLGTHLFQRILIIDISNYSINAFDTRVCRGRGEGEGKERGGRRRDGGGSEEGEGREEGSEGGRRGVSKEKGGSKEGEGRE